MIVRDERDERRETSECLLGEVGTSSSSGVSSGLETRAVMPRHRLRRWYHQAGLRPVASHRTIVIISLAHARRLGVKRGTHQCRRLNTHHELSSRSGPLNSPPWRRKRKQQSSQQSSQRSSQRTSQRNPQRSSQQTPTANAHNEHIIGWHRPPPPNVHQ